MQWMVTQVFKLSLEAQAKAGTLNNQKGLLTCRALQLSALVNVLAMSFK